MNLLKEKIIAALCCCFFSFFSFVAVGPESVANGTGNKIVHDFDDAKRLLEQKIFNESSWRRDFYCNCTYDEKKNVDWKSCGFKPQSDEKRAKRIEWEHIVPAHAFGQSFKEWREGDPQCVSKGKKKKKFKGRKCVQKVNATFRLMEADLYNLVPAVGEVNGDRQNFSFAELPEAKDQKLYGECKFKLLHRKVEPRDEVKGFVARTYLYMNQAYPKHGIISHKNEKLFAAWNEQFPVTEWECERARRVEVIQQNENVFVKKACETLRKKSDSVQPNEKTNQKLEQKAVKK